MEKAVISINGIITPASEAKIPVLDRGFIYGDSLYEVARTVNRTPFQLNEHFDRLWKSSSLCKMPFTFSRDELLKEVLQTIEAFKKNDSQSEVYTRIMITRGIGEMGLGKSAVQTKNQRVIYCKGFEPISDQKFTRGMSLCFSSRIRNDRRALDPAMKSGNYLNSVLAYLEAEERGFDDAILCNAHDQVTEGTTFNLFAVIKGVLRTAPLSIGILDGITRRDVIRVAKEQSINVLEEPIHKDELLAADEIFITSTLREVFPILKIEDRSFEHPGPITQKLRIAYREWAAQS